MICKINEMDMNGEINESVIVLRPYVSKTQKLSKSYQITSFLHHVALSSKSSHISLTYC